MSLKDAAKAATSNMEKEKGVSKRRGRKPKQPSKEEAGVEPTAAAKVQKEQKKKKPEPKNEEVDGGLEESQLAPPKRQKRKDPVIRKLDSEFEAEGAEEDCDSDSNATTLVLGQEEPKRKTRKPRNPKEQAPVKAGSQCVLMCSLSSCVMCSCHCSVVSYLHLSGKWKE